MKIYKLSRVLSIPFALIFIWFLYQVFKDYTYPYFAWAIIPAAIVILLYLFQPQIDYWWLDRNPVEIEPAVLNLIKKTNPHYSVLSEEDKREFNKRLLLYVEGREFIAKGMEKDHEVVYDIKYMMAQMPVTMTLNHKDFLLKNFERLVIYKHAFATPVNRFLHTVEVHEEDGVLILSLEHLEAALFNPMDFYNIGWHGFAQMFIKTYSKLNYPSVNEGMWSQIENVTGWTKERILNTVGYDQVDLLPVIITLYFTHRKALGKMMPEVKQSFDKIF